MSELFNQDDIKNDLQGQKITPVPMPKTEIGIDTDEELFNNIIGIADASHRLDMSELNSFTYASQDRNKINELLDTMSQDTTIAAALEIYAEDVTETNEFGQILWCESDDEKVSKYINYLLDSMNVDKEIYRWALSLIKYGDLYLKLYRQSEMEDPLMNDIAEEDRAPLNERLDKVYLSQLETLNEPLNEDIIVKQFKKSDKFVQYVEMVDNPATIFELTKFGKTFAYIEADTGMQQFKQNSTMMNWQPFKYQFRKSDVKINSPMSYAHASLQDNVTRTPEEVSIILGEDNNSTTYKYKVKSGQSILYNLFKIWRQTTLLENSMMLNRLTRSSMIKIYNVEVGSMPKENVPLHLNGIKQMIEQKTAINTDNSMAEYTNPGPMENSIYVPTRNNVGGISVQEVGGTPDSGNLDDIDYFKTKEYAGLKIPKTYLGDTDDAAGFSGGQSLSLISSRYAKTIKRIQNTLIQALTDVINILLLDRGLANYINKYKLRMQAPTTQEEQDRVEAKSNRVGLTQDILSMLDIIEDPVAKLKATKIMISELVSNDEILDIIQDQIDKLEEEGELPSGEEDMLGGMGDDEFAPHMPSGSHVGGGMPDLSKFDNGPDTDLGSEEPDIGDAESPTQTVGKLPTPAELGQDMTQISDENEE